MKNAPFLFTSSSSPLSLTSVVVVMTSVWLKTNNEYA